MSKQFDPAENDLPLIPPLIPPAEATDASGNNDTSGLLNDETTREREREQHTANGAQETSAPARSRRARGTRAARAEKAETTADGILHLPVRNDAHAVEQGDESDEAGAVAELEAQGFTADEAIRLVHESNRVATLRESREAEATLRRLRFTRWLVERGVLDEFSA